MPSLRLFALTLLALTLASCDGGADEPVPVGTFSVEVTGDIRGSATGTAFVAEPDSGLNMATMEWEASLPVRFETTGGNAVEVSFTMAEPVEPNGSFTELPEGTFRVDNTYDPTRPTPILNVRVTRPDEYGGSICCSTEGTTTLRRRSDGAVEGTVRVSYSEAQSWSGPTRDGQIDLRFTVPPR